MPLWDSLFLLMRVKLARVLTRTVRPHLFETRSEAQAFHERRG